MNSLDIARGMIKQHEGLRLTPYKCTAGKLTIGYGRNLDDKGISQPEAFIMLENDLMIVVDALEKFSFWEQLSNNRQAVLIDMCFNLGLTRLIKFKKTLAAIEGGDFDRAAKEMLDSRWKTQVGNRATKLANMMVRG